MGRTVLRLAFFAVASLPSLLSADRIVLTTGEILEGKLIGKSFVLETAQGSVEASFESIQSLEIATRQTVTLTLVDGVVLAGELSADSFRLRQGLFERTIPLASVRQVAWTAPTVQLPADTKVSLLIARSVTSTASNPLGNVPFCVANDVEIEGKVLIRRHSPALGQVLGTGGGMNVEGGDTLAVRAGQVLAVDGVWIPLKGTLQVHGGYNAAKGLLVGGDAAVLQPGVVLEAAIETTREVSTASAVLTEEQTLLVETCAEYFRFAGMEVIPVEQMKTGQAYAPVPQPLRASVPIRQLISGEGDGEIAVGSLRNLYMDGVSLPVVKVSFDARRKGEGVLRLDAAILVPPSHDRWVTVGFHAYAGEGSVRGVYLNRIDAEERKVKQVSAQIELSASEMERLLSAEDPRVRITLTAIEN